MSVLVACSLSSAISGYSPSRQPHERAGRPTSRATSPRRSFLVTSVLSPLVSAAVVVAPAAASAFDNRLDDKYLDATPQVGTQPINLGAASGRPSKSSPGGSYAGLAPCPPSPNCWCSSAPFDDNAARYLGAWKGGTIRDVKKVVDTYEVGQGGIDGGGFRVVEYDDEGEKGQYLYAQFQSYKAGYVDDVEFWFNPEKKKFDVRSASRIGYSDLGVNAKRLEYIGGRLEKEFGWELPRRKSGALV